MVSQAFLSQVKARHTKRNGSPNKLKRPAKWLFPHSAERQYTRVLYQLTLQIRNTIESVIIPALPFLMQEATYSNPRADSFIDQLNQLLQLVTRTLNPFIERAAEQAKKIGIEIGFFNQNQFNKVFESVFNMPFYPDQPWLDAQMEIFANQNAQLIESLTEAEINRVANIIQVGLQQSSSINTLTDEIQASFGIARRHAKFIARDQTAKLNSSLARLRMEEVGIERFEWQTSGDERVRHSHRVLDGKLCRWDNPNLYFDQVSKRWVSKERIGGDDHHPGQNYNCRCTALPIFEDLIK